MINTQSPYNLLIKHFPVLSVICRTEASQAPGCSWQEAAAW